MCIRDSCGDIHGSEVQFDLVGIELSHFCGFAHQSVEAIGFFVNYGQQLLPLGFVEVVVREQAGDCCLDAGEWGAQFVGDGIEQDGAQIFALMSRFGLRELFDGSSALNGDADHAAQGLQSGARECWTRDADGSGSTRAQMQRRERNSTLRINDRFTARTYHLKILQSEPGCFGVGAVNLLRTQQIDGSGFGAESVTHVGGNRIQ